MLSQLSQTPKERGHITSLTRGIQKVGLEEAESRWWLPGAGELTVRGSASVTHAGPDGRRWPELTTLPCVLECRATSLSPSNLRAEHQQLLPYRSVLKPRVFSVRRAPSVLPSSCGRSNIRNRSPVKRPRSPAKGELEENVRSGQLCPSSWGSWSPECCQAPQSRCRPPRSERSEDAVPPNGVASCRLRVPNPKPAGAVCFGSGPEETGRGRQEPQGLFWWLGMLGTLDFFSLPSPSQSLSGLREPVEKGGSGLVNHLLRGPRFLCRACSSRPRDEGRLCCVCLGGCLSAG